MYQFWEFYAESAKFLKQTLRTTQYLEIVQMLDLISKFLITKFILFCTSIHYCLNLFSIENIGIFTREQNPRINYANIGRYVFARYGLRAPEMIKIDQQCCL